MSELCVINKYIIYIVFLLFMTYIYKYMSTHNLYIKHAFMLINDMLFENLLIREKLIFLKVFLLFLGF
jgi:hypothetical protein